MAAKNLNTVEQTNYEGLSDEELKDITNIPGNFSPEYLRFVKHYNKKHSPLSLTGNQIEFIEFMLSHPKQALMLGAIESTLRPIKQYLRT